MRWRVLFWSVWLFLALAFSVRFIFADGEPCYDCQNCWENIINCATNGNGNCSSNCVKFSPSDCSNFVSGVFAELETISNSVEDIEIYIHNYFSSLENYVYPSITNVSDSVRFVMSALDNYSSSNSVALASAVSLLGDSRTRLLAISNHWSNVDGRSGQLYVSNMWTSVIHVFDGRLKITTYVRNIVPRLDSAISILSDLDDYSINEIGSARSDLEIALTFLDDVAYTIQQASENIQSASSLLRTINNSSDNIARSVSSVNCEPCGRGGGGSGGSSGGMVDFTGVSAQLDEIKSLLQQVYDLIYYYYTDYNSARSYRPSGEPSYQSYASLGDNWFKRVEYLLYSSSSIASNNLEGASDPDTIEGQTAFENETSQLEESLDTVTGSFDESLSRPWTKFSEHFSQFWDRLNVFKLSSSGSSGQLGQLEWSHLDILSYSKDGHGFTLQAQSDLEGFPSVWYKFAVGFRVLWFLLVLTLYCLFFVFMIKYSYKVAVFVSKLLNTSFGSG